MRDIPTLEEMGKAVLAQATGPQGKGADKKGKPIPDKGAGGHFTLAALKRLQERGAFNGRE